MESLKIHIIDYREIIRELSIKVDEVHLKKYLEGGREDILENIDIFCENVRSRNCSYKNFSLFQHQENINTETTIVLGLYLELLVQWEQIEKIKEICFYYCKKYSDNKIVVQWNHDIDSAKIFNFINELPNLYILNFNSSIVHSRFLLLPFWAINTELLRVNKKIYCNLICSFNHISRINLKECLKNDSNFFISENIEHNKYRELLSSSYFSLCPRGGGLSSYRFFECFHLNTIPVLIGDDIVLPFDDIDYSKFILRIPEDKTLDKDYIISLLKSIDRDSFLWELNRVRERFTLKGIQEYIYKKLK